MEFERATISILTGMIGGFAANLFNDELNLASILMIGVCGMIVFHLVKKIEEKINHSCRYITCK
ncbi:hypothetical protein [Campylobacter sp. CCUG 57310]|uniref:hypothetical protein n=1 Tax=Campylobacter sp. CCUG 57310 TaxID=2517362 RepID=UPI00156469CC|nr:hypothetical protein [Campylobacter sp. CCUG 57310]QKF91823.1 hypothetical protein CORI_0601 [Campylobacter sp. CCUG 57310]